MVPQPPKLMRSSRLFWILSADHFSTFTLLRSALFATGAKVPATIRHCIQCSVLTGSLHCVSMFGLYSLLTLLLHIYLAKRVFEWKLVSRASTPPLFRLPNGRFDLSKCTAIVWYAEIWKSEVENQANWSLSLSLSLSLSFSWSKRMAQTRSALFASRVAERYRAHETNMKKATCRIRPVPGSLPSTLCSLYFTLYPV